MIRQKNKSRIIYGLFSVIAITIIILVVIKTYNKKELPVYNPSDFNPQLVDHSIQMIGEHHKVASFSLTNQNGEAITQQDYEGKVYVADFFFTRCPSICPVMSNNMERIQETFKTNKDLKLLSISVTPEIDSVSVLRQYASKHGAIDSIWNITTGNKKHIYKLARTSYFAVVDESDGLLQDFIHTPNFVLIDKEKQIRGIYNGTKDSEILRLIEDIETLLN